MNHLRLISKTVKMDRREYSLPQGWESSIRGWLSYLRASGTRDTTLKVRRGQVRAIARRTRTAHPRDITLNQLVELCSGSNWSREHRKGVRAALISFYDWCVTEGECPMNTAAGLPKVAAAKPRPRPATDDIWRDLLATAPPRERLMARLACEAGMRRAEVAQCHRDDLIVDLHGYSLIVHGKGGKQRVVPIPNRLATEIRSWCPGGFLFVGAIDGHMSAHHVGKIISRLMPEGWSMHKLRHRYASRGYAGTGNLRAVQEALGHSSVATTQIYTLVSSGDVRAVSEAASNDGNDAA